MLRKLLALTILLCMCLHCAGRLGVLSWVYEKRQTIAYAIGVIQEVPIAICNSQYDFQHGLQIDIKPTQENLPSAPFHADEINLFFVSAFDWAGSAQHSLIENFAIGETQAYSAPRDSVFRPPLNS